MEVRRLGGARRPGNLDGQEGSSSATFRGDPARLGRHAVLGGIVTLTLRKR